MSALSVPVLVMASITIYVGIYSLVIYLRWRHREHLPFAVACLAMGLYDLFCAGLYSAASVTDGARWQRLQIAALSLVSLSFPWFVVDFSHTAPVSRGSRRVIGAFSAYFVLAAILDLVERWGLCWRLDRPSVKVIRLPFLPEVVYHEVAPGPLTNVQSVLGVVLFIYVAWILVRIYRSGRRKEAWPLLLALGFFFLGAMNDTAVSSGLYRFVYTMEYAYMGIVLLMTVSLTGKTVEAGVAQESLQESEERFRSFVEQSSDGIILVDEQGRIVEFNPGAERLTGMKREECLGQAAWDFQFRLLPEERRDDASYERLRAQYEQALRTGRAPWLNRVLEASYQRADGTRRVVQQILFPIQTAKGLHIGGTSRDVTEQRQAEESLRLYTERLKTLHEIDQAILVAESPEGIAQAALQHLRRLVPCRQASVALFDFQAGEAVFVAGHKNDQASRGIEERIPLDDYGLTADLQQGQYHLVEDIQALDDRPASDERLLAEGVRSYLSMPLLSQGQLIGALNLGADKPGAFTLEHVDIARETADQVAMVIQQIRLRQELQRHARQLEQRTAQLEALRQLSLELAAQLDADTLLSSIAARAAELLGGTGGGLYLYRPERDVLEWSIGVGPGQPPMGSILHRGEGLSGKTWETGEPLMVDDYWHWEGRAAMHEGLPNVATVSAPVRWGDEFLGVLSVVADIPHTFSADDAQLLTLFATQAAIAIRNARFYREARGRAERLAVVNRIARAVSATLQLDDLLESVYRETVPIFHTDTFFIALYDEQAHELDFRFRMDEGVRSSPDRLPAEVGLSSLVIAGKKPLLIRDIEQERERLPLPQLWGSMKAVVSWLGVPMLIGERVVGVICVQSYTPHAYGEDDQLLLSIIADQVAVAVEKARLYQTLRDSEEKYRTLFEQANDAVFLETLEGHILEVNQRACQLLGYEREELLRLSVADVWARQMQEVWPQRVRQGIGSGMRVEAEYVRKDGSRVAVEVSTALLEVGGVILVLAMAHDITERKQAEVALRESEVKHRLLLNSIRSPILALQRDMTILYCNDAYAETVGIPIAELEGQNLVELFPEFQSTRSFATFLRVLETGEAGSAEGKVGDSYLRSWVYPTPWGILTIAEDITERRRLEDQLRQTQKMEAIGTLAGGIAHDFNNILTSILGYASLVQQDLPSGSPFFSDLGAIIDSASRAADLTRQLLTFARRSPQMEMGPIDLNVLVHEVVRLLGRTIDKSIAIDLRLAEDLRPAKGDSSQLHQTLLNLCLNARDAMPNGGQLTIETRNVRLLEEEEIRSALDVEAGEYVLLSVTDTGEGMAPLVRERVFEPFFTTKEHGRGLGLAMVYGIVRGHGGAVHVYTEPGRGTAFKVYLPAHTEPAEALVAEDAEIPEGRETVLVVDDEENVRGVLQRMLERAGYTVLLAGDGVQAVDLFLQRGVEIDLVVLDVTMPHMGGQEAYQHLKEIAPQVKVLLSSGYSETGKVAEILAQGAQGFLQKPFDLGTVLRQVRQALDGE